MKDKVKMKEFVGLRAKKTFTFLLDDGTENKKAKDTKRKLKFEDCKNYLKATQNL